MLKTGFNEARIDFQAKIENDDYLKCDINGNLKSVATRMETIIKEDSSNIQEVRKNLRSCIYIKKNIILSKTTGPVGIINNANWSEIPVSAEVDRSYIVRSGLSNLIAHLIDPVVIDQAIEWNDSISSVATTPLEVSTKYGITINVLAGLSTRSRDRLGHHMNSLLRENEKDPLLQLYTKRN